MWNLQKLGEALSDFISEEDRKRTLETYPPLFLYEYRRELLGKLGLLKMDLEDEDLLRAMLNMLVETKIDYTQFFRSLSRYKKGSQALDEWNFSSLSEWLKRYDQRLEKEEVSEDERWAKMLAVNPKFILRNYLAQMAIENTNLLNDIYQVLTNPFLEWEEFHEWSRPAPVKYRNLSVSCSS